MTAIARAPLYAIKNPQPFTLRMKPGVASFRMGIRMTESAFSTLHSLKPNVVIDTVSPKGVRLSNGACILPPSIYLRGVEKSHKIFISEFELGALAKNYGVGTETIDGAFFSARKSTNSRFPDFFVQPCLNELMDPQWKDDFLAWVAGQGPLPLPSKFQWTKPEGGAITIPCFPESLKINGNGQRKINGVLSFSMSSEGPAGVFAGRGIKEYFTLSPQGVRHLKPVVAKARIKEHAFDRPSFLKLFGFDAQDKYAYSFFREIRGQSKISFCSVQGEPFSARLDAQIKVDVRKPLFFTFQRKGQEIKVSVYRGAEKQAVIGTTIIPLAGNGYPFNKRFRVHLVDSVDPKGNLASGSESVLYPEIDLVKLVHSGNL